MYVGRPAGDHVGVKSFGRGRESERIASRDRPAHRRPWGAAHQRGGDAELPEHLGNRTVIARTVAMSGHRDLLPVQILRRQRTDTGKPMTAADQDHPALSAKLKPSQISGGKTRRSQHHIQVLHRTHLRRSPHLDPGHPRRRTLLGIQSGHVRRERPRTRLRPSFQEQRPPRRHQPCRLTPLLNSHNPSTIHEYGTTSITRKHQTHCDQALLHCRNEATKTLDQIDANQQQLKDPNVKLVREVEPNSPATMPLLDVVIERFTTACQARWIKMSATPSSPNRQPGAGPRFEESRHRLRRPDRSWSAQIPGIQPRPAASRIALVRPLRARRSPPAGVCGSARRRSAGLRF
jgi:hypothetical protein